jgi:tetratricopeptide (TPR) repeat protein
VRLSASHALVTTVAAAEESERLSNAGHIPEALASMQEAVSIYRSLAAASPERYRPDLGDSLSRLSVLFGHLGQNAAALPVAEEAVQIIREVASTDRSRHSSHLARSLLNLGLALWRLGRYEDAVAAFREALAVYREIGDVRAEDDAQRTPSSPSLC